MTPTPPATQIRLQHFDEGRLAAEWRFARAFRIGRDAACDVCLENPRVHARHAEIYLDGAVWRARDLGRGLATLVNGAPLHDVNGASLHDVNGASLHDVRLGSPSTIQFGLYGPVLRLTIEPLEDTGAGSCITATAPEVPSSPLSPPAVPRPASPPRLTPAPWSTPPAGYQGNGFTLPLPEDWHDQTLYTLAGPLADGIRHTVLIEVDRGSQTGDLDAYVANHVRLLCIDLDGFRLLKQDEKTLVDGTPAQRLIFRWAPHRHRTFYQEQLFIHHEHTVYKLTASFTNASRKQLGHEIEALMLGFKPGHESAASTR